MLKAHFKSALTLILTTATMLLSLNAHGESMSSALRQFHRKYPSISVGYKVLNTKGKVLSQSNASHLYLPASNTKLLTAATAVLTLSPNFQYQTELRAPSSASKGQLSSLTVYFSGDPSFTSKDLDGLFSDLKQKGVRKIKGDITLAGANPQSAPIGLGMPFDDRAYCFAAPVGDVIIDQNCSNLTIRDQGKNRRPTAKSSSGFSIDNQLQWVDTKGDPDTCVFNPIISNIDNQITLKGCLPARKEWFFKMAIANPWQYAQTLIRKALDKQHIQWSGRFKIIKSQQPNGLLLASERSATLKKLLHHMLIYSDNNYAGALTRSVGLKVMGVASIKAGVTAIERTLKSRLDINLRGARLEDGSGLSRYNLLSPDQLSQLALAIYNNRELHDSILPNLPTSGRTGTLRLRLTDKTLAGKVKAKTGSFQGTFTLTGYFYGKKSRKPLIFSIMLNGNGGPSYKASLAMQSLMMSIQRQRWA